MTHDFETSSICSQFVLEARDRYSYNIQDFHVPSVYKFLFEAIASDLKLNQDKDCPRIGFKFTDDKGQFKFGAVLNYNKPEENNEDDGGSFYLEYTFYEEDMTDLDKEITNHSSDFKVCMVQCSLQNGAKFRTSECIFNSSELAIDVLKKYLDINANETETVDLVLAGIFTASVAIEDGKKVYSIVPGETVKQIVKNDKIL